MSGKFLDGGAGNEAGGVCVDVSNGVSVGGDRAKGGDQRLYENANL